MHIRVYYQDKSVRRISSHSPSVIIPYFGSPLRASVERFVLKWCSSHPVPKRPLTWELI